MSLDPTAQAQEASDRLAIRNLVDAYAYCADSRDATGQMALFTEDTHFVVFMNSKVAEPSQELHSRAELAPVFAHLNTYHATMHFNGQSTVVLQGDRASGLTYCMAHHLTLVDGKQQFMVAAIRYRDTFAKTAGQWLFAERQLLVDWVENR
jgi:ketosteroid isomerase-like protein